MSKIRFIDNDYSDFATTTASAAVSGFPSTNATNSLRSKVWKPSGNFTVDATNNLIYINTGSNLTATLTAADYTPASLATHVQTQLNAVSSGWTCTYSTSTYKFTIGRSSSATLRFATTTTAAWDMLGFTAVADSTGTSFVADESRNHTSEYWTWDCGVSQEPSFLGIIGPLNETFTISENATVTIKGNNIPVWTSPGFSATLDVTDRGVYGHIAPGSPYRYWRLDIVDRTNTLGPTGLKLGRIFLGDHATLTATNVSRGFSKTEVDPSDVSESQSGVRFYNQRTKYRTLSALEILNLPETDRLEMESVFSRNGIDTSFFLSLDPTLLVTPTTDDLTLYGNFSSVPSLKHLFTTYYSMSFDFREAV